MALRLHYIGEKLVDSLPPHVSLIRRFSINQNYDEQSIINIVKKFNFSKIDLQFKEVKMFSDAIVLTTDNKELFNKHKELVGLLGDIIKTTKPEFEGNNFKAHLTLFRDKSEKEFRLSDFNIKKGLFNKIVLFEIAPDRSFAKEIFSKKL